MPGLKAASCLAAHQRLCRSQAKLQRSMAVPNKLLGERLYKNTEKNGVFKRTRGSSNNMARYLPSPHTAT